MTEQNFDQSIANNEELLDQEVHGKSQPAPNLDALLDQIDSVLEQNAQEFVESFVQKGGQ